MAWESLKSIMPNAIKKAGIHEQITAQKVLEVSARVLELRWGEEKSSYVSFDKFSKGTLTISSKSPAAIQTLNVEKVDFINSINHELNHRAVLTIKVNQKGY